MSWDAWHNAKDEKLIRLSCDEKTSKNCWNSTKFDFTQFSIVFERFLSPGWSDLCLVFCIVSGILRHKFRVPTKGTLVDFFFTYKGVCAKIAAHCGRSRWLKKSWKSVHGFINIFPTIYFLGKIIWQLFAKMGHPNAQPAEAGASLSLTILPHKHSPAELEYDIMSRYWFPCEMGGEIKALLSPGEAWYNLERKSVLLRLQLMLSFKNK